MALRDDLAALLRPYGLDALADAAAARFVEGMPTAAELELWLEGQEVVKREFAAVFERRARGLAPISIADVVDYRRRASELASYYDVPQEFFDVNRLMVEDVSVSELGERVQTAAEIVRTPERRAQLQAWGLSEGDAIAVALDPDSGLPAVKRRLSAVQVAAQATRQGFGAVTLTEAEGLADLGVDEGEAEQGFGTLGRYGEVTQQLVGEQDPAMSRESQLGVVAGAQGATSELERRARGRKSVFDESGGVLSTNQGLTGAGSAGR